MFQKLFHFLSFGGSPINPLFIRLYRYTMTTVKSAENTSAFGPVQPGQFPRMADFHQSTGDSVSPAFSGIPEERETDRISELFRMNGIDLDPEELNELTILEEFLVRHVQDAGNCDVQCMLLWNEWVRVYRRRASGFPNLIREKEFRSVVTGKYGTMIAHDGWRGAVYPGVRYIP